MTGLPLTDDPALAHSPMVRAIGKIFAYIAENGPIGLTPSMAFKRVFVHWAAAEFGWPRLSDFTCVSSWRGMVHVAFVIDVFARKIAGWRVPTSMTAGFVVDALNQAICQSCPSEADNLIHHSPSRALLRNTLPGNGSGITISDHKIYRTVGRSRIDPSVGSVGDSYDNALAESTIGCSKPGS